jgi:adenylosuccinate synthase
MSSNPEQLRWLIDAVRKQRQVEHFRAAFGPEVLHVHLTADELMLRERYEVRLSVGDDYVGGMRYELAVQHPNEIAARALQEIADYLIDTSTLPPERVADAILHHLV